MTLSHLERLEERLEKVWRLVELQQRIIESHDKVVREMGRDIILLREGSR